jgi:hypothetical protein
MPWGFESVYKLSVGSVNKALAFDGKYIWTCDGVGNIKVVDFWGYSKFNELEYNKLTPDLWDDKLTIKKSITLTGYSHDMVFGAGYIWVMNIAKTKITRIDVQDYSTIEINLPTEMDSNIAYGEDKIWFADKAPETQSSPDTQNLYYLSCSSLEVSSGTEIPNKKQIEPIHIAYGKNGYVYLTNFNDVSVSKFDASDGSHVTDIRVNREPTHIYVDEDLKIWVSSYGGMLSSIDNLDAVTHSHGTVSNVKSMADDGTYFWVTTVNDSLLRINKSTKSILEADTGQGEDYELLLSDSFSDANIQKLLITPAFTYEAWNGSSYDTIEVKQYVFAITNSYINTFRNYKPLIRENFAQLDAVAMISTGEYDYTGD